MMRTFCLALLLLLAACRTVPAIPTPLPTSAPAPTVTTAPVATAVPLPTPTQYDERAEGVTLDSAVLGIPKSFYVYLPPDYAANPDTRYPVLYLFRGHEREWVNPNEDGTRQGETVIDVYEELLAAGDVGEMILVFPGISSDDNSIPGVLTNFSEPERAGNAEGIGTGQFEAYFLQELIPYVDATYRTRADPTQRGVDGFSLGGYMATKIAAQHPDLFRSAGAFDGLYFYTTPDCQLDDERDTVFDLPMFAPAFGSPRDAAYGAANNAPTLICAADSAAMQSLDWFIQYGPESAEPNDANYFRGEHLVAQLTAKGVVNGMEPVLVGGHNWATADEHMRQSLPLHWQAFND